MGVRFASGFAHQGTSGAFYGNENSPKLLAKPEGQRTMPGGPMLPRLPRNPYAVAARKIGTMSTPRQPKNRNGTF